MAVATGETAQTEVNEMKEILLEPLWDLNVKLYDFVYKGRSPWVLAAIVFTVVRTCYDVMQVMQFLSAIF